MEKKASEWCWDFDVSSYKVVKGPKHSESSWAQVRLLKTDKATLKCVPSRLPEKNEHQWK